MCVAGFAGAALSGAISGIPGGGRIEPIKELSPLNHQYVA